MVRLVEYHGQYKITLPIDIVRDKGWASGTEFRFVEDINGSIILKPIERKEEPKRGRRNSDA